MFIGLDLLFVTKDHSQITKHNFGDFVILSLLAEKLYSGHIPWYNIRQNLLCTMIALCYLWRAPYLYVVIALCHILMIPVNEDMYALADPGNAQDDKQIWGIKQLGFELANSWQEFTLCQTWISLKCMLFIIIIVFFQHKKGSKR